jgi:hypothetical protein
MLRQLETSMAHVSFAYISASTNRHSQAADVSSFSRVACGSSNMVALWDVVSEIYNSYVYVLA